MGSEERGEGRGRTVALQQLVIVARQQFIQPIIHRHQPLLQGPEQREAREQAQAHGGPHARLASGLLGGGGGAVVGAEGVAQAEPAGRGLGALR